MPEVRSEDLSPAASERHRFSVNGVLLADRRSGNRAFKRVCPDQEEGSAGLGTVWTSYSASRWSGMRHTPRFGTG